MRSRRNRRSRLSAQDMAGIGIIAACLLGFAAMLYTAARIDAANGISVSQSLANWGFGRVERKDSPLRQWAHDTRESIRGKNSLTNCR